MMTSSSAADDVTDDVSSDDVSNLAVNPHYLPTNAASDQTVVSEH